MIIHSFLDRVLLLPFQLAIDINVQIFSKTDQELTKIIFKPFCDIDTASDWINLEALGNTTALRAQECAQYIGQKFKIKKTKAISLHLTLQNYDLTIDNLYFITFLSEHLEKIDIYVPSKSALPLTTDARYIILREKKNINIIESNKDFSNEEPLKTSFINNQFSIINDLKFPFKKENSLLGFNYEENIKNSIGYAWTLLKIGGYPTATNLLEILFKTEKNGSKNQEDLLMHLQLIRFHSHQYVEMTEQSYPSFTHLDKDTIRYLYYIKAYAATLSRNISVAKECFLAAGVNIHQSIDDEFSLYQLNIFALFHVLSKDIDTAYQLELKIENAVKQLNIGSIGLKYVNFINLARLYKHLKQYDISLQYYEKAYTEIADGGFTTSDYLYYNMNLGSLYENMGNQSKALYYWFKAALHWVTAKNPYALAWRPKIILAQENTQALNTPLSLVKTSDFFAQKLFNLSKACNLDLTFNKVYSFSFNNEHQIYADITYLSPELVLYGLRNKTTSYKEMEHLETTLSSLVNYFFPVDETINHIVLDSFTEDWLRRKEDVRLMQTIHQSHKVYFKEKKDNTESTQTTITFKKSALITIHDFQKNGIFIKYKRSFMNKILSSDREKSLFEELLNNNTLTGKVTQHSILDKDLFNLLSKNVIDISKITIKNSTTTDTMLERHES